MGEFGKSGGGQLLRPLGEELQRETSRDLQDLEKKSERVHEAAEARAGSAGGAGSGVARSSFGIR